MINLPFVALCRNPEGLDRLRADPNLIPATVVSRASTGCRSMPGTMPELIARAIWLTLFPTQVICDRR